MAAGKRYRRGTHRSLEPAQTVEALRPWLREAGITRVANVTGLDVVGLPVVVVCRPNARSNAVAQGKGLDLDAARASGLMEAMETWCAERLAPTVPRATAADLGPAALPRGLARLPRVPGVRFDEHTPIAWAAARDIMGGGECRVPYELVHADFRVPYRPGSGHFLASTNGLASGNTWLEAVSHGICELVERDASARFKRDGGPAWPRRLDLASVDDDDAAEAIDRLQGAGLAVAAWDLSGAVGLPVFGCHIMEAADGPGLLPLPAEGFGCHPDRGVALARALTEAAQSRLTALVGARDDIGPAFYGEPEPAAVLEDWRRVLASRSWGRCFREAPHHAHPTLDEDVDCELAGLAGAGLDQVLVTTIAENDVYPFAVVRVIVCGLAVEEPLGSACGGQGATRAS